MIIPDARRISSAGKADSQRDVNLLSVPLPLLVVLDDTAFQPQCMSGILLREIDALAPALEINGFQQAHSFQPIKIR